MEWFLPLVPLTIDLNNTTMEAYISFDSQEDVDTAVRDFHRKDMGRRYVEVFASSEEEYGKFLQKSMGLDVDGILKLRGLPFSATAQDICEWLIDYGVTKI